MKNKYIFSPGDIIYYPDNLATAILLEYDSIGEEWVYSLRSPLGSHREGQHFIKVTSSRQQLLYEAVESGKFVHYQNGESKNENR